MKKIILLLFLFYFFSFQLISQISYSGILGKSSINLTYNSYDNDVSQALYVYNKYDTPIKLQGKETNKELVFTEKDKKGRFIAKIRLSKRKDSLIGYWTNIDSTKSIKVQLIKDFEIKKGEPLFWTPKEIIQLNSTEKHYFKTILSKRTYSYSPSVTGIKVFEKGTDKLIQTFKVNCDNRGIDNVAIDDYNFDGLMDFSVFEAFYTGPNTSSIYILKNPDSQKYFISDIKGSSLEFDKKEKRIYEHNQSQAGNFHMNATYKLVNNKMVLIERVCIKYSPKKEDFITCKCD